MRDFWARDLTEANNNSGHHMVTAATITLACTLSLLAVSRQRTGAGLGIVICSMLLWPEDLRIPLGIVQMSVPRFVAAAMIVRLVFARSLDFQKINKIDVLVIATWLWTVLATAFAEAEFLQISQMIGRGLDTVLLYFIARLALSDRDQVLALIPWLVITALVMGVVGVYETLGFSSPYRSLMNFGVYETARLGLIRAMGSTSHAIQFGLSMMLLMSLIWSVRGYTSSKFLHASGGLAALLAALSSMSSGPWLATLLVIILQVFYYKPYLIRPSLKIGLLVIIVLEIASNRHFYELVDRLALDSQTAWYRTRLIEVAFQQWRDFWLIGVGSNMPHHWADMIDYRDHVDVVNNFILVALYGGLPALVMFITAHVLAIKRTVAAWKQSVDEPQRQLLFGLASTLVALDFASMSVSLFGPPLLLSHILLGLLAGVTAWPKRSKSAVSETNDFALSLKEGPLRGHRYVE